MPQLIDAGKLGLLSFPDDTSEAEMADAIEAEQKRTNLRGEARSAAAAGRRADLAGKAIDVTSEIIEPLTRANPIKVGADIATLLGKSTGVLSPEFQNPIEPGKPVFDLHKLVDPVVEAGNPLSELRYGAEQGLADLGTFFTTPEVLAAGAPGRLLKPAQTALFAAQMAGQVPEAATAAGEAFGGTDTAEKVRQGLNLGTLAGLPILMGATPGVKEAMAQARELAPVEKFKVQNRFPGDNSYAPTQEFQQPSIQTERPPGSPIGPPGAPGGGDSLQRQTESAGPAQESLITLANAARNRTPIQFEGYKGRVAFDQSGRAVLVAGDRTIELPGNGEHTLADIGAQLHGHHVEVSPGGEIQVNGQAAVDPQFHFDEDGNLQHVTMQGERDGKTIRISNKDQALDVAINYANAKERPRMDIRKPRPGEPDRAIVHEGLIEHTEPTWLKEAGNDPLLNALDASLDLGHSKVVGRRGVFLRDTPEHQALIPEDALAAGENKIVGTIQMIEALPEAKYSPETKTRMAKPFYDLWEEINAYRQRRGPPRGPAQQPAGPATGQLPTQNNPVPAPAPPAPEGAPPAPRPAPVPAPVTRGPATVGQILGRPPEPPAEPPAPAPAPAPPPGPPPAPAAPAARPIPEPGVSGEATAPAGPAAPEPAPEGPLFTSPFPVISDPLAMAQAIMNMSAERFGEVLKQWQGGLTGLAHHFGQSLTHAAQVDHIAALEQILRQDIKAAQAAGDFDKALALANKSQFFRETIEAATGTGSAGEFLRKTDPNYKPPVPEGGNGAAVPPEKASDLLVQHASGVADLPLDQIHTDPDRFQYKVLSGQGGQTGSLRDVQKYDKNLAGILLVWRDPADGKVYVINGHNRLARAKALGEKTHAVRFIDAANAQEARSIGAMANIAEGQGTAVDAAKFFRDTGLTPEDLRAKGLQLTKSMVQQGVALSKLNPTLFDQVAKGEFPIERAALIGDKLPNHTDQRALLQIIDRAERGGRELTDEVVAQLADQVADAPTIMKPEAGGAGQDLFGVDPQAENLALTKADLQAYIAKKFAQTKNAFGAVATESRANLLKQGGQNAINVEANRAIRDRAAQDQEVFNTLKNRSELGQILNEAAVRIGKGEDARRVREETFERIKTALSEIIGREQGQGNQRSDEGSSGGQPPPAAGTQTQGLGDLFSGGDLTPPPTPHEPGDTASMATLGTVPWPAGVQPPRVFGGLSRVPAPTPTAASTVPAIKAWFNKKWGPTVLGFQKLFAPQSIDDAARIVANMIREYNAEAALIVARADKALASWRSNFDTTPVKRDYQYDPNEPLPRNYQFIDNSERGGAGLTPSELALKAEMQAQFEQAIDDVHAVAPNALRRLIQDYFPHIWSDPKEATRVFNEILARRPLEGTKGFLKKRVLEYFRDGLEAGLKPVHDNPVDMHLLKLAEMRKFIMAQKTLQEAKAKGYRKFVYVFERPPDGFTMVNDRTSTVNAPPVVTIEEAFDAQLRDKTIDFLRKMGFPHTRKPTGFKQGVWGTYQFGTHEIKSKFAGPDWILWHEAGHGLEERYHISQYLLSNSTLRAEVAALANERAKGVKASPAAMAKFRKYIQSTDEQMAAVLQAYLHAPALMDQIAPNVKKVFQNIIRQFPELAAIDDIKPSMVLGTAKTEMPVNGMITLGHWYMPEGAAAVLNNHLSPGLGRYALYRGLQEIGNSMNAAQLGLSAFHLGFTSLDASVSTLATGLVEASRGNMGQAAKNVISSPVAPILNYYLGKAVQSEMLQPGTAGQTRIGSQRFGFNWKNSPALEATIRQVAELAVKGGLRATIDPFYQTEYTRRMKRAFYEGGVKGYRDTVLAFPFAMVEQSMRPIAEFLVPRQKLGVFAKIAESEMRELGPGASHEQVREAMAKAADTTEDRMGQMTYDNLFYNRIVKDAALIGFRAYGWTLGKYRAMVGATTDTMRQVVRMANGQMPQMTQRMAYPIALAMGVGTIGAILHRLFTGQKPQSLVDAYFPGTGQNDQNGRPQRLMLPSYLKDMVSDWKDFPNPAKMGSSFYHKLNPGVAVVTDLLRNRDFYDVEIYGKDDPFLTKQVPDMVKYIGKSFMPFAVQGMQRLKAEQAAPSRWILPFFGIVPAKQSLTMTPAESKSAEITQASLPRGSRTHEEADHGQLIKTLVRDLKNNPILGGQELGAALTAGQIRPTDPAQMLQKMSLKPLQYQVWKMPAEGAMQVYDLASPEEKSSLQKIVQMKLANAKDLDPKKRATWIREALKPLPDPGR